VTASLLLLIKLSVSGLIFTIGMDSTGRDLLYLYHRPRLLVRSLVAMYVAVPAIALLAAASLPLSAEVRTAIIVLAISAGAPLLPRKLMFLGRDAYVVSLVITSSLLAIILVPAWLAVITPLYGRTAHLAPADVARVILPSFLAPLALGMMVRWLAPDFSARWADRLLAIVSAIFAGAALILLAMHVGLLLAAGWLALLTLAGLTFLALVAGHALGGPDPDNRTALAVCCSTRHVGLAALIAAAVPGPRTAVYVLAYLAASAAVSIPYLRWRRRMHASAEEVRTGKS
jgi:BASS family bile acid:Na+ symporter